MFDDNPWILLHRLADAIESIGRSRLIIAITVIWILLMILACTGFFSLFKSC